MDRDAIARRWYVTNVKSDVRQYDPIKHVTVIEEVYSIVGPLTYFRSDQ